MRFLVMVVVLALFWQGIASAGDINPVQKNTQTFAEPTQKTTPQVFDTPTQKVDVRSTPAQKVDTFSTPVQKGDPQVFDTPTQKGYSKGVSANSLVEVPQELLCRLSRNQGRGLGKAIARKCIKKKIANYIQDQLPSLPTRP